MDLFLPCAGEHHTGTQQGARTLATAVNCSAVAAAHGSPRFDARPKPLVEIGGRPIIWHIMNIYAHYKRARVHRVHGYKSFLLKEFFANLALHNADVTVDVASGKVTFHDDSPARLDRPGGGHRRQTMTGGRVRRVQTTWNPTSRSA